MSNIYAHARGNARKLDILGDKEIQQPILVYFISKTGIT